MKYYIILFISLSSTCFASAQNIVKMTAVKATDYGVAYSLPKTAFTIKAEYTKTSYKAGDFYQYADRYLNISNPITKDEVVYTLDQISASTRGIADKEKSYLVEFKTNSTAPFVLLTQDGLICAINADYTLPAKENPDSATPADNKAMINPKTLLSEEILRAGSTAKQAELIAKKIYHLRESRSNILTGEADSMPPDGNAYKLVMSQLEEQEKALTSMFIGTVVTETGTQEFEVVPTEKDITDKIIFRFSKKLGIVAENNLAGAPIYFNLINLEPKTPQILTPKEEKALADKFAKGIIYNIPAKASLKISFDSKNYVDEVYEIAQYGWQEVLAPRIIDNNKAPVKVTFYHELGSIKEIK